MKLGWNNVFLKKKIMKNHSEHNVYWKLIKFEYTAVEESIAVL